MLRYRVPPMGVATKTIKMTTESVVLLRLISLKLGERQYAILDRILTQEAERIASLPIRYGSIPHEVPRHIVRGLATTRLLT